MITIATNMEHIEKYIDYLINESEKQIPENERELLYLDILNLNFLYQDYTGSFYSKTNTINQITQEQKQLKMNTDLIYVKPYYREIAKQVLKEIKIPEREQINFQNDYTIDELDKILKQFYEDTNNLNGYQLWQSLLEEQFFFFKKTKLKSAGGTTYPLNSNQIAPVVIWREKINLDFIMILIHELAHIEDYQNTKNEVRRHSTRSPWKEVVSITRQKQFLLWAMKQNLNHAHNLMIHNQTSGIIQLSSIIPPKEISGEKKLLSIFGKVDEKTKEWDKIEGQKINWDNLIPYGLADFYSTSFIHERNNDAEFTNYRLEQFHQNKHRVLFPIKDYGIPEIDYQTFETILGVNRNLVIEAMKQNLSRVKTK